MTLTTLILTNVVLAGALIYALVHFLTHAIHADRRHRASRVAELSALPERVRDRIAA
ncbi:MAG TPA: hypothetical protein VFU90_08835 [Candidatus Tumulicola sp.]|nr:hypothetical protein [Candidatus Tumulicola sp.]